MKIRFQAFLLLFSIGLSAQQVIKPGPAPMKMAIDEYHGIKIEDPYRNLENLEDPAVASWMKEQANYARAVLDAIPGRQDLLDKFYEFDSRSSSRVFSVQITTNHQYFYLKSRPEDDNARLYFRDGFSGAESLVFDPTKYNPENGVNYVISSFYPDHKGNKLALFISPNGSENAELLVIDKTGRLLDEPIGRSATFLASWLPGDNSFLFLRFNTSDIKDVNRQMNMKAYLHTVGTPEASDVVYLSNETNPQLGIAPEELPIAFYDPPSDMVFGILSSVDTSLKLYMAKPDKNKVPQQWKKISTPDDKIQNLQVNERDIYYLTFKDAANYKIIKTPLNDPDLSKATIVVPESKSEKIENFSLTSDGLYYSTMRNGVEARAYFLPNGSGNAIQLELPFAAGSINLSNISSASPEVWMNITGWTSPGKRLLYHRDSNTFEHQQLSTIAEYPELQDLVVKEITVTSHDGVAVPVSIVHKKDLVLDGNNPALIYGYGSYGISNTPFFSPIILNYVINDGIFVVPHVRGGGELGDNWHRAGQKLNKPNTWKDAIATAEYLIDQKYSSSDHLAIWGGSAGGIFVGRSITERPDLFAAAIPMVGAMNPVRMEETPNGPVNTPEFGTVKDPDEFRGLVEMDSYLHLEKGTKYPATLITAGMNDPRVIAWEPAKFAAKLAADNGGDKPILFWTDFEAGHGIGDSKSKSFQSFADVFSFALWQTGHPKFQPSLSLEKN